MNGTRWVNRRFGITTVIALIILILVFSITVDTVNGSAGAVPSQSSPSQITGTGASVYHLANWGAVSGRYIYSTGSFSSAGVKPLQDHIYELPIVLK
jgi:hypothetical protein